MRIFHSISVQFCTFLIKFCRILKCVERYKNYLQRLLLISGLLFRRNFRRLMFGRSYKIARKKDETIKNFQLLTVLVIVYELSKLQTIYQALQYVYLFRKNCECKITKVSCSFIVSWQREPKNNDHKVVKKPKNTNFIPLSIPF